MPNLFIDIEARYAKFQDSLTSMERDTRRAVSGMEAGFNALKGTVAGLAAAISVGAVVGQFTETIAQLADLDDAAEKTGASVESLSSLLNTLKPSGANLEQITDLAGKLTRAMAGADEETSSAAAAFKALQVETKDAAGNLRPVDDVLVDVAKSLNEYADGSNKVALVQAILSKSGAQYLPLLKDLATTQREAATVTAQQAADAETLQKAWAKLATETDRLRVSAFGPLITALADVATKFNEARRAGLGYLDAIQLATMGIVGADPAKELQRQLAEVEKLQLQLDRAKAGVSRPLVNGGAPVIDPAIVASLEADIARRTTAVEALRRLINSVPAESQSQSKPPPPQAPRLPGKPEKPDKIDKADLTDEQKAVIDAYEAIAKADKAASAFALKLQVLDAAFFDGKFSADAYDAALKSIVKTTETAGKDDENVKLAEKWRDAIDPLRQYVRQLEEIRRLVASGALTADQGLSAEFVVQLRIDDESFGKIKDQVDKTKGLFDDVGEAISSSLGQGVLAGDRLTDSLKSLGQTLLSIGVREFLTKPFSEFLSQGLKSGDFLASLAGLFGSTGSSGGGGGGFSGISLPGRALGGPVIAGKAYMVGEVGPEVFVPKSNGVIVPNNRLGAGGGVTINQVITVESGASRGEVLAAMSAAKESAKREIYESMRRGGAFANG